ncbi:MAG: putative signal transducing protein [Polyangiales bacterium]
MTRDEEEWIEIRRFGHAVEAEITRDFLRDHGVRVAMRGEAGGIVALTHLGALGAIRLWVPRAELDKAEEALAAMRAPADDGFDEPEAISYRNHDREEDDEPAARRPRPPWAAPALAILFPIGGGHLYAQHLATGWALAASTVCCFVLSASRPFLLRAAVAIVLFDAIFSPRAVRETNARNTPTDATQLLRAAAMVAVSLALAAATAHY